MNTEITVGHGLNYRGSYGCTKNEHGNTLSYFFKMYKDYINPECDACYGEPTLVVSAHSDEYKRTLISIGIFNDYDDDADCTFEVEMDSIEEQMRVFKGMVNYYNDIKYDLVDPCVFSYLKLAIIPHLSYLTGGKNVSIAW